MQVLVFVAIVDDRLVILVKYVLLLELEQLLVMTFLLRENVCYDQKNKV